jgi:aminoglycoside N3'-acetyltransferase
MRQVTQEQIIAVLQALGVHPGDGLMVHSALHYLGQPLGGIGIYYRAICAVLDGTEEKSPPPTTPPVLSSGTVAVPTFNFAFARGEPFDPQDTPSVDMGAFSEYVRLLPQARRTSHPMQSLAVVGHHAADLARRDTASAFDPGSAFERMLELDFKLLLLGADIQAVAMLHYCEQRAGVPYRYWKDFTGKLKTPQGWQSRTYRMFVRELQIDPKIELYPVQDAMQRRGQWFSQPLNYGYIALCRLIDFVAVVDEFLARDPWSLVTNRPTLHF